MAGDAEEHVVERGATQADVLDRDAIVLKPSRNVGQRGDAVGDRSGDPAAVVVDLRLAVAHLSHCLDGMLDVRRLVDDDLDLVAADRALELGGRVVGDGPPAVDDRDAVGEPVGLLEVLRRQQHSGAGGDKLAHRVPDLVATARVKTCRRLVQEHQTRRKNHARRKVEPAPHAAAVLLDSLVAGLREVELLEQLDRALAGTAGTKVEEPAEHLEVLPTGEDLVDSGVLPGEPDVAPHIHGLPDDVEAADQSPAAVGADQCREDPHRGRLARAVGPEQPVDRAIWDFQVEPVEGPLVAVPLLEAFHEDGHVWAGHALSKG